MRVQDSARGRSVTAGAVGHARAFSSRRGAGATYDVVQRRPAGCFGSQEVTPCPNRSRDQPRRLDPDDSRACSRRSRRCRARRCPSTRTRSSSPSEFESPRTLTMTELDAAGYTGAGRRPAATRPASTGSRGTAARGRDRRPGRGDPGGPDLRAAVRPAVPRRCRRPAGHRGRRRPGRRVGARRAVRQRPRQRCPARRAGADGSHPGGAPRRWRHDGLRGPTGHRHPRLDGRRAWRRGRRR